MQQLKGIHHVTAITGNPQKNVDFYSGLLGLRLVKKTVNFDDPGSYHLYYGDQQGSPGSLITFFAWPGVAPRHTGSSETVAINLQIPKGSLPAWESKLSKKQTMNFLNVVDPDGICVNIVEGSKEAPSPDIQRIHSLNLDLRDTVRSSSLFNNDLRFVQLSETLFQVGNGDDAGLLHIRHGGGGRGTLGAGSIHHIAFRTEDGKSQEQWRQHVASLGLQVSPVMDRQYFKSIYFREPSGVLFEIATDPPGMMIDEPLAHLGESLRLPPQFEADRAEIEAALPPLRLALGASV